MSGFKPQRKIYKLKFTDEEYEGLEVLTSSASMGAILEIQGLAAKMGDKPTAQESLEISSRMMNIFAKSVIQWNLLDEDDNLVPTTVEGLASQDPQFVMSMIAAWTEAVAGVSAPLERGSTSGETFQGASQELASLSQSRVNYTEPSSY